MRNFKYICFEIASSSYNLCDVLPKNGDKSDLIMCFYSFIKNVNYGLVIIQMYDNVID